MSPVKLYVPLLLTTALASTEVDAALVRIANKPPALVAVPLMVLSVSPLASSKIVPEMPIENGILIVFDVALGTSALSYTVYGNVAVTTPSAGSSVTSDGLNPLMTVLLVTAVPL